MAPSSAAFTAALAAAVSAPLLYFWATWGSLDTFVRAIDNCAVPLCDFARHYDPMGRTVFEHRGPVPGFLYTPGFAIALAVLSPLSKAQAALAWWVMEILSIGALLWSGWVLLGRGRRPVFVAYVALLFTAYPLLHNLKWGQVSAPITALLLLALVAARSRSGQAQAGVGLLLAGAVSVKLYPVLFAPAVLRRGRWCAIPWFLLGTALLLAVVPALVLGVGETVDFYRAVFQRYTPAFVRDINSQYAPAVAGRWLDAASDRAKVELVLPQAIWPLAAGVAHHADVVRSAVVAMDAMLVALNAWLVASLWWRGSAHEVVWMFVVIAATLPFVVPTCWPHYFVHLPFCQVWVLHRMLTDGSTRAAITRGVLLLLPSAALSNVVVFNVVGSFVVFNFFGATFWASLLLLLAVYGALPRTAWAPPWRIRHSTPLAPAPSSGDA